MPWPIVALVGHAVLKGVAAQAGKHAYDKVVKHKKSKKHDQNPQPQPSSNRSDSSNYTYPDAYCDGCGKFISDSNRDYCFECQNSDLDENYNSSPYIVTSKGVHDKNYGMLRMVPQHQESFVSPRNYSASGYSLASCDVCGMYPIVGIRYKCLQCPDFDLCERCHYLPPIYRSIRGHTAYHNMLPMIQ